MQRQIRRPERTLVPNAAAGSAAKAFTTIDLTHAAGKPPVLPADAAAVFAVPVYGGRVAPAALERLQEIRGEGTPAVVLAVYGNRAFGTAVAQLAGVRRRAGIRSRGGRGFRGRTLVQHARHADRRRTSRYAGPRRSGRFRSAHRPKACARRDRPDRRRKTPRAAYAAVVKTAVHPFRAGVPQAAETQSGVALLPAGDAARCTQCGRCVALCPTQAIARGDELHTDPARCIRCCACVKGCAFGARTFETPFAAVLSRNFARRKPP